MALTWKLHGDGRTITPGEIVRPDERLAWPATIGLGLQHVVAMFGATFLVPLLTGFPPTTTLFFSGVGTVLFLLVTRNRLPSYLGSSFAFIAPITAATASDGRGGALFGIVVVGLLLALVGAVVAFTGTGWIDVLMPPVVAGAIVALIGLNLAPVAKANFVKAPWVALITLVAVLLWTVAFRGLAARLSIFFGVVIGYVAAVLAGQVDFTPVARGRLDRAARPHHARRLVVGAAGVPAGRAGARRRERRPRAQRRPPRRPGPEPGRPAGPCSPTAWRPRSPVSAAARAPRRTARTSG